MIEGVIVAVEKMATVKVHARDLKVTLDCLKPVIQEIAEYNKVLHQPTEELDELTLQLEQGAILVGKCSKLGSWSLRKRYKYANQLLQLDQSLHALLHLLEVQKTRDIRETLVSVKNIESVVRRIETNIC